MKKRRENGLLAEYELDSFPASIGSIEYEITPVCSCMGEPGPITYYEYEAKSKDAAALSAGHDLMDSVTLDFGKEQSMEAVIFEITILHGDFIELKLRPV